MNQDHEEFLNVIKPRFFLIQYAADSYEVQKELIHHIQYIFRLRCPKIFFPTKTVIPQSHFKHLEKCLNTFSNLKDIRSLCA